MAKYIDAEKLLAEIERRLERYDPHYTSAGLELKKLLSFVNSLQQEQPVVDLEKEQKPIEWTELTWKDVNELEEIMNEVHSDYRGGGIGQKSFGLEVLERFRYIKGDELDIKEQKPEVKHIGWVARDSKNDSYLGLGLVLFKEKPIRSGDCWSGVIDSQLPWESFPDLKWEDEPVEVEVEVTIKRK